MAIRMIVFLIIAIMTTRIVHQLPICVFCKQIRDGADWVQIEQYITNHSQAEFTHGYCPSCAENHYGEYLKKPKEEP
jgi:hypothetical protein